VADQLLRLIITASSTQAQKDLKKLDRTLGNAAKKMKSVGASMTQFVTLPVLALGAVSVKLAADFETSMNQVQAATDAPASSMKSLSDLALKMGADTIYSAGEAADAMLELAKSGLTPAQIKAGALEATLQLAAAGGLELADAATTAANAMNSFGLKAKDMAQVANALSGGANASSASVESLRLALSQVGPGARNAGMSIQETVAVLAAFADKGIQGADAGTSLKTMLTRLVPDTDKAAIAMKTLGLNFVDSKGNIDDITVVAEKLKDKLGGLSEAERIAALNTIFGSDATRGATVLMLEGAKGIQKYIKATSDKTAAEKMAAARMKGLNGALEQLKGSLETSAIIIGQELTPTVMKMAGELTKLTNEFGKLDEQSKKNTIAFAALAAAIGPVLWGLGSLLNISRSLIGPLATAKLGLTGVYSALALLNAEIQRSSVNKQAAAFANLAAKIGISKTAATAIGKVMATLQAGPMGIVNFAITTAFDKLRGRATSVDTAIRKVINSINELRGVKGSSSGNAPFKLNKGFEFASGGWATGSKSGYPATLHGTELVTSFDPRYRAENIANLQAAAQKLGASTGGTTVNVTGIELNPATIEHAVARALFASPAASL